MVQRIMAVKMPVKREDAKGIASLGIYYEKVLLLNK